jgi:hypothetical protein
MRMYSKQSGLNVFEAERNENWMKGNICREKLIMII